MVVSNVISRGTIKLNPNEVKKFGKAFRKFVQTPENQKIKMEIVDIFTPHLERKAASAAAETNGKISAIDYVQDLYLKLLESLELAAKDREYAAKFISDALNKTKPTADTLVTYGRKTIEELSTNELRGLSYSFGDKMFQPKAFDIIERKGHNLTRRRIQLLEKFLDGKNLEEIANEFGITLTRTQELYNSAIRKLQNNSELKYYLKPLHYDDISNVERIIQADKPPIFKSKTNKKTFTPEETWEIVKKNLPPIDVEKELNDIMKTQTNMTVIFSHPSSAAKFKKHYQGFKFKIELPKKCDTPEFKNEITKLSKDKFGWNIFKFVEKK